MIKNMLVSTKLYIYIIFNNLFIFSKTSLQRADESEEQLDERATWLPTRDTESSFTEMVYNALIEVSLIVQHIQVVCS